MKSLVFASTVALAVCLARSVGAQAPCPDKRASQVAEHVSDTGPRQHCGFSVHVFGLQVVQVGNSCQPIRVIYPTHQDCTGEANEGTRCVFEGSMAVRSQNCGCSPDTQGGATSSCTCTEGPSIGTIEDFRTSNCVQPTS